MASNSPPRIFSAARRAAIRKRAQVAQQQADAPHYLLDNMVEEAIERLSFVRHEPKRALVVGDFTGSLAKHLSASGCETEQADPLTLVEEQPYPSGGYDFIASMGTLDTVNDLPGALIHMRHALAPSGLAIAQFVGAGSLSQLRAIMLEADGDRPAARMHPLVDVRAGAQLLQRAGWSSPVVDSRTLSVRYSSLARLVSDLRAQGLSSALASSTPPLGKAGLERALAGFAARADQDGKLAERFEVLALSGWKA